MNQVTVKPENEEEDDEENGRATPKRKTIYDYEDAQSTMLMCQSTTENNKSSDEVMQQQISNEEEPVQTHSTQDTSNCSAASVTGVVVKDEPQDIDNAALENSGRVFRCELCPIKNETEEPLAPEPPIPEPPIIPSSSFQRPSATDLNNEVETVTGMSSRTPEDIVVKSDVQDSAMEPDTPNSSCAIKSITENTTTPPLPQISLVPTHCLRVKPEFSETSAFSSIESSVIPQDFFDDLLPANPPPPPRINDEAIPDNFFDDLLVDQVKERIEEAETLELEEKFSDRLKLLRELDNNVRGKDMKKHKKSKKKSRKRRRSRSRDRDSRSPTPKTTINKRIREEIANLPSTSNRIRSNIRSDIMDDSTFQHCSMEESPDDEPQRKLTFAADIELVDETGNTDSIQPHLPEIGPHLTAKQKRDRIVMRAKSLIDYLKREENAEEKPMSTFLYTSTVRKLPLSHSYRTQHIYENRSPLHSINNVSYRFNSHRSHFNFEEWGLDSLPPLSAKIAKLVGYDAAAVYKKLKVIKIPAKLRNIKSEGLEEEDEVLLQSRSSLFSNAATQTNEMVEIFPRKTKGYDVGVQVQPAAFEIACQTLETESPSIKQFDNSDDLPIMTIMRELNENQLMALHDFAELLNEPATNAIDMYRLRQRMLDIYKCSQMPSALATPVPTSGNSYTSNESSPRQEFQQQRGPALSIQTVCNADGQRFSVNDPRIRGRGVTNNLPIRNASPVTQSGEWQDPRNQSFSQRPTSSSHDYQRTNSYQMQQQQSQPPTNNGNKYYGRGGLRR